MICSLAAPQSPDDPMKKCAPRLLLMMTSVGCKYAQYTPQRSPFTAKCSTAAHCGSL
jgi:hypothetical protein